MKLMRILAVTVALLATPAQALDVYVDTPNTEIKAEVDKIVASVKSMHESLSRLIENVRAIADKKCDLIASELERTACYKPYIDLASAADGVQMKGILALVELSTVLQTGNTDRFGKLTEDLKTAGSDLEAKAAELGMGPQD